MSWFYSNSNNSTSSTSKNTRSANEEALGKIGTLLVHSHPSDPLTGAVIPPINLSTTFEQRSPGVPIGVCFGNYFLILFQKDFEYSRSGNPTRALLESALARLEGGSFGLTFASGLAALTTIAALLKVDDHVILLNDVYGGTVRYFTKVAVPHAGIQLSIVPMTDPSTTLASVIRPTTKV